jgi:hypothetical protein
MMVMEMVLLRIDRLQARRLLWVVDEFSGRKPGTSVTPALN